MGLKVSKKEALGSLSDGKVSLSLHFGGSSFGLYHMDTNKLLFNGTISDFLER
jgi:hypothetical protein